MLGIVRYSSGLGMVIKAPEGHIVSALQGSASNGEYLLVVSQEYHLQWYGIGSHHIAVILIESGEEYSEPIAILIVRGIENIIEHQREAYPIVFHQLNRQ